MFEITRRVDISRIIIRKYLRFKESENNSDGHLTKVYNNVILEWMQNACGLVTARFSASGAETVQDSRYPVISMAGMPVSKP